MKSLPSRSWRLLRPIVWAGLLHAALTGSLPAKECRVLVMSPGPLSFAYGFPGARLTDHLRALLEGSGQYSNVLVTYRSITMDASYSTSLLGAYYVPPYRTQHIAAVQSTNWTHVVMIDRPFFYAVAPELHYVGVNAWAKLISRAGAQPVLMMPWVDRATMDSSFFPVNNAEVREFAYRVGDGARDHLGHPVPVVPAGVAWSTLPATNRGTLPSQPSGGVILNTNGEYTAAASLYTYLTGDNAKSVNYLPPGMTASNRDAIADHVVAVLSNEANAVHYTGAFANPRMKLWAGTTNLNYSEEGTSTEVAIADQLLRMSQADGMPVANTQGTYVNNANVNQKPSNLVFARYIFLTQTSLTITNYDSGVPPTTMLATFDRQDDSVANAIDGAIGAESQLYWHYYYARTYGFTFIPYHLLWVRTMYDLNLPIDNFNVHAPDWQFAATASAMYTLRTGGRNGVHPSVAGRAFWSPKTRTDRFAWQTMQMAWETMMEMSTLTPAPSNRVRALGFDRIIDAERFHEASGPIALVTNSTETLQLSGLQDGDWTAYDFDFGSPAPHTFAFSGRVAASAAGAQIEVRHQGPTGTLFGTVNVPSTGGANTFQEIPALMASSGLTGTQQVALVYRVPGGVQLALDYFRLTLLARDGDSAWINPVGGPWTTVTNWAGGLPNGTGVTATFSFELPGAGSSTIPVTYAGTSTLGRLVLGQGIGTNGGVAIAGTDADLLRFDNGAGLAEIRKPAGGADQVAVPILVTNDLRINNRSTSPVSLLRTISGGGDVYPFGQVRFEGANYDLGRVGYGNGYGMEDLAYPNTIVDWLASGTIRNLSTPIYTTWNVNGAITNLGWTDLGNDNSGTTWSGTFNMNGGVFHHATTNFFRLGNNCTMAINLNGGILDSAVGFTQRTATITLTLNGGILRYSGATDLTNWIVRLAGANRPLTTQIGLNGARFDIIGGRAVTYPHDLTPVASTDGGVEKLGDGTLTLSASNSFRGPVAVRAGTLRAMTPYSLGSAQQFTVPSGSVLDIPGPQTLLLSGTNASWTGTGTLMGNLSATQAYLDVASGSLSVTGSVTLDSPSLRWLPRVGAGAVQAQGALLLAGTLTLNAVAPTQAIASGATIPLFTGASRIGTFGAVTGSTLWTAGYTASGMVLTANANIPSLSFALPNGGTPVDWGQSVLLSVGAEDAVGIASVEFFSGDTKLGDGVGGPAGVFTFNWFTGAEPAQTYAIRVRVTNLDGVVLESAPQSLVVSALTGTNAVWTQLAGGLWSITGNWHNGVIADAYRPAHFDELDLPTGITTVQVDSAHTVSLLRFTDTLTGTPGRWKLAGTEQNPLTISGGAPEIEVVAGYTELGASLDAPQGFAKTGSGTLDLSAPNHISNNVVVSEGILSISHSNALGSASILMEGGTLALTNSSITIPNALQIGATTQALVEVFDSPTWAGHISAGNAAPTGAAFHIRNNFTNTASISGDIELPKHDILVTVANNGGVRMTGDVTARVLRVTGASGAAYVIFAGNARAEIGQLATLNNGLTAYITIEDNAELYVPAASFAQRSGFNTRGGILTVAPFTMGSLAGFTCDGGVIRPTQSSTNWIRKATPANTSNRMLVSTGGLVVDTDGYDVAIEPSLITWSNPDGGITKRGTGVLTMMGSTPVPTWRGTTTVEVGTLKIAAPSRISANARSFLIASGTTFDIADSTSTPTLVMSHSSFRLAGSGTLRGGVTLTDGRMVLTAGQPLKIEGAVQLGPTGTRTLEMAGSLPGPGNYPLVQATSLSGTFSSILGMPAAPTGFSAQLVYEATQVLIRVSGPGDAWLATNAAPGAGFGDDPDGNGLSYLQEYVFGRLPGAGAAGWITAALETNRALRLGFSYNVNAVDVAIHVDGGNDLFNWTPLFSKPTGSSTGWVQHTVGATIYQGPVTGGVQAVTISGPLPDLTNSFLMIHVQRPP